MQYTRWTADDGTVTWTVDQYDDETTVSLELLVSADPAAIKVDVPWIGLPVTIVDQTYRITAVNDGRATLTKES